jgi:cysteine desulfurase
MGIDMLSASGHKIGCPKGVGVLYKRKDIKIRPLIYGSQMDGLRGSTENVPYIMGMAKAVELCNTDNSYVSDLREYFIYALEDKFGCKVNGDRIQRLPNNINVTFPQNVSGEALLYMLDTAGIQIGVGSACNSRSIQPSHVLKAIGLSDDEASRTIRITLSKDTTIDEIDETIEQIDKAIKLLTMEDYDCEL